MDGSLPAHIGVKEITALNKSGMGNDNISLKPLFQVIPAIVFLFAHAFICLVMIALVLAAPIAYLLMRWWLDNFTYGVEIAWETFAMTGLLALAIAW